MAFYVLHINVKILSHTRTVVLECCKGDDASQWGNGKFDPSPRPNPLTDRHRKLHTRIYILSSPSVIPSTPRSPPNRSHSAVLTPQTSTSVQATLQPHTPHPHPIPPLDPKAVYNQRDNRMIIKFTRVCCYIKISSWTRQCCRLLFIMFALDESA